MSGHSNIWEGHISMKYVFTFHRGEDEQGHPIIVFRRIGTHKIYRNP